MASDFRSPIEEWSHIIPIGRFKGTIEGCDGKSREVVQVIDDRSIESMVRAFRKESLGEPNFPGLLVDYEHFSYDTDKASEAAGWISDLDSRPDGLWAKIRWSDTGGSAVENGRYRFASPVWLDRDTEEVSTGAIRPLRLDSVALTNKPNLKGAKPLSNRRNEQVSEDFAERANPPSKNMTGRAFKVAGNWHRALREAAVVNRSRVDRERKYASDDPRVRVSELNSWIDGIRKRDRCDFEAAYNRLRTESPGLFAPSTRCSSRGISTNVPTVDRTEGQNRALRVFNRAIERAVHQVAAEQGCDFAGAWALCQSLRPSLFAAMLNREDYLELWAEQGKELWKASRDRGIMPEISRGTPSLGSAEHQIRSMNPGISDDKVWSLMQEQFPDAFWGWIAYRVGRFHNMTYKYSCG